MSSSAISQSFWASADKIPVRQTKVSIPAEHGLNYTDGQTIWITIPPTIDYIQPKETYLRADCLIDTNTADTRMCLDKMGGNALIRDIRVYSGGAGGQLLEEIQSYNVLASLRYSYEQNESLRNKRELTEGGQNFNPKTRGTAFDSSQADINNVSDSLYTDPFVNSNAAQTTAHPQKLVKMLIPLNTGIFQNNKVFPCLLTQGLRIEILLENAPRVLQVLDQVNITNRLTTKVLFHSAETTGASAGSGGVDADVAGTGRWTGTDTATSIWVRRENGQWNAENFPFKVGEEFDIIDNTASPIGTLTDAFATYTTADGDNVLRVLSIQHHAATGNAAAVGGVWGLSEIVLVSNATKVATMANAISGELGGYSLISRGIALPDITAAWKPTYTLSNVALITQQIEMPSGYTRKLVNMMKEGGVLNYGFLSYTNYKYSQQAGDIVANIRLPLQESKCKSVLCIPTDSSVYSNVQQVTGYTMALPDAATADYPAFVQGDYTYNTLTEDGTDGVIFSTRSGLVGIWDFLTSYQWFYDGRLNPSRKVDTSQVSTGKSLSQQWNIEGEKALAMGGIRPLSFRDCHTNAFIGRAVALQDGVYDARNRDFNLQVEYNNRTSAGVATPPVKNKLWNCYSCHIRTLQVKGDQISVQV